MCCDVVKRETETESGVVRLVGRLTVQSNPPKNFEIHEERESHLQDCWLS